MTDLYNILGVLKDADEAEIKRAYRGLSKLHHPDAGGDQEKFIAITTAYQVLHDPEKRKKYDETGVYDNKAVMSDQQKVTQGILELFIAMLQDGRNFRTDRDLIKGMVGGFKKGVQQNWRDLEKIIVHLQALGGLSDRIVRGDEETNIFHQAIKHQIGELEAQETMIRNNIRLADMAIAELENYKSIVEIVETRMVWSTGPTATSTNTGNIDLTV